jgi:hypothetical protein
MVKNVSAVGFIPIQLATITSIQPYVTVAVLLCKIVSIKVEKIALHDDNFNDIDKNVRQGIFILLRFLHCVS